MHIELASRGSNLWLHDDVMTWKLFPYYCPFVRGIHRSPVDSPHKRPVMWTFDVHSLVEPEQAVKQRVELPAM